MTMAVGAQSTVIAPKRSSSFVPQGWEARDRDGAEPHDAVQGGDVVEARIDRQHDAVSRTDTSVAEVRGIRAGTPRRVRERPAQLTGRGAVCEKDVRQRFRRCAGRNDIGDVHRATFANRSAT